MSKMKNNRYILILVFVLGTLITSCDTEAPYLRSESKLTFVVESVSGTHVEVSALAADDRSYYFFDITETSRIKDLNISDYHLMMFTLDVLYRNYLEWRFNYIVQDEAYITDFRSHTFQYGPCKKTFSNLKPNTDYTILGFCIDPDNIQEPIGKLYKIPVHTSQANSSISNMNIDLRVDVMDYGPTEDSLTVMLSMRPSEDGMPTRETYAAISVTEQELREMAGGDLLQYALLMMNELAQGSAPKQVWVRHDIVSDAKNFHRGDTVWFAAAPFTTAFAHSFFTRCFVVEPNTHLPYGHDEKTDYSFTE